MKRCEKADRKLVREATLEVARGRRIIAKTHGTQPDIVKKINRESAPSG